MKYRQMPHSKDRLSALGLGLMRLPTLPSGSIDQDQSLEMMHYALDHGVNYFDTAWGYHDGESEPLLGKFLAGIDRQRVFAATKLPCWLIKTPSDLDEYLDKQLNRLQTDYIDYYLLHALNHNSWKSMLSFKALDWLDRARADGKIRHIGFSFHDKYPVFKKIAERYDWDFCQFMFNFLDTRYQAGMNGYKLAVARGMGIIAMEPVRGGKLVSPIPDSVNAIWAKSNKRWAPVERALRWVWNLPGCTVLLSGMSNLDQLKQNIALAGSAKANGLDERELKLYGQARLEYLRRIAIPCTECRYCLPCPHKVAIPGAFGIYNEAVMFDDRERHQKEYEIWLPEESRADKCVNCGACLPKCPQKIDIPKELAKVAKHFPPTGK